MPQSEAKSPFSFLTIRLIALGFLIFLVNAWITSNLDEQLVTALIANGVLLVMTIVGSLVKYLDEKRVGRASSDLQRILLFFLRTPVLLCLYFAFIVMGSLRGTVSVSSDGLVANATVRVAPTGELLKNAKSENLDDRTTLVRFLEWTTPFGRPYSLEVDGFVPTSFDLYPWVGKRIRLASDMIRSPSLLIRVPYALSDRVNGAKVTLSTDSMILGSSTMDTLHWSVLVGQQQPFYSTFLDKWLLEFKAGNFSDGVTSRCLLGWREPLFLKPVRPLVPGLVIEATIRSRIGVLLDKQRIVIGSDRIQDVVFK